MDLKDLAPKSDTVEVKLVHPVTEEPIHNEDGSQMSITLYAPHSEVYKNFKFELTNVKLEKYQKSKGEVKITAQEIEKDTIDLLVAATKSWDITYDGKKPRLSDKKATEVYTELFWMRPQLEEGLANSLDFTVA